MTTTPTRRKAKKPTSLLLPRIRHYLTTTTLSVAQVAVKLKTNKRYVRQLATLHSLPTNRHVTPGGPAARSIADITRAMGKRKALRLYRFSRPKLAQVLASL